MDDVLKELVLIKWLLSGVLAVLVIAALLFAGAIRAIKRMMSDDRVDSKAFLSQAEVYDSQNEYQALRSHCENRLKNHQNDKWALYYLGVAALRLGDYPAAKAHFTRIRELDPSWESSVVEYLDEIKFHLDKHKPRSV